MAPSIDLTPKTTALEWNRPHPLTIVVEIGSALRQILVALAIVGFDVIEVGSLIELAVVAGPLAGALARWYTTRYAVDAEALHHHHGLIWRRRQVLPRANIQNVATTAGVVARMGSVVELQVSDASSNGDIKLRFVSRAEAERLTSLLRSRPPAATQPPRPDPADGTDPVPADGSEPDPGLPGPPDPGPLGPPVEQPPLVSPTLARLARVEVTSLAFLAIAAAGVALAVLGPVALWLGPELPSGRWLGPWQGLSMALVFLVGAAVVTLVSQLTALGGYRLSAEPDRLRIQVGLLTEARITARRERIQQLKVERNLVQRRLGLERVQFETADVDIMGAAGTRYLDPAADAGQWRPLAMEAFGRLDLDEPDLVPVSPLTRRRTMVRFALAAVSALALAWVHPLLALVVVVVVLVSGWWYSRRRHRELGWALSDDQFLVRTGVVVGELRLVDLDKVQNLRLSATFFQRRLGLATFQVATAGHGFAGLVRLPDLDVGQAEALLARMARRASVTPVADTL